jgi:hypothetical protein
MEKKILRIFVILMLVLMGSAQAMAQGLKIKRFSYAKSGETLRGEQLYARTIDSRSLEREQGYAPYSWILYLENGGTVELQLPDGQKHQVGLGKHSFTYHNGEDMYIDVSVVPYAVPYLGGLRLQGAVSHANVHLEKTVSEEDFFTYTIKSDADLKTIKINPQGGYDIDGNLGIHAALTPVFPERDYKYAKRLRTPESKKFINGVSVAELKDMAVQQGLNPNDFVLQIGLDDGEGGSVFSEVYLYQARYWRKTTFLRIIDKRLQIKKVTLTTQISPVGAGSVLINGASQSSIQVDQGTQVHLKAQVARQEYEFDHWQDAAGQSLGTDSQLSYVVKENTTLSAHFKKKEYVLKAVSSDQALGTVNPATLTVKAGGEASFTATAKENAIFKGWKQKGAGSLSSTQAVLHLTNIQEASEWIAVFEKKPEETRTLTVKVEPEHAGKVLLDGENQSSITVKKRTSVRLKVEVLDQNYEFRRWETAGGVSLGNQTQFDYLVEETETVIAVFEKKASTPQVGPVEINFGQREALLTWAAGSATSWTVKVYQGEQVVFDQEIQTPQLVLVGLKPGENYRYEIVAKMSGKLPSQAVQGSFRTDEFDVNDSLTPHLKNFSKLERNKSFPIILLDVDPRDFPQEMTVEAYSLDEREVKSSLALRNDGKIYWMILPEGKAKALVFVLKSGSEIRYELTYDLSK